MWEKLRSATEVVVSRSNGMEDGGDFFLWISVQISWHWGILSCGTVSQGMRLKTRHLNHLTLEMTKQSQERKWSCFALFYCQHLYFCNAQLWIHCRGSSVGRGKTNILFSSKEHRNIMLNASWFCKCSNFKVWLYKTLFLKCLNSHTWVWLKTVTRHWFQTHREGYLVI